LKIEKFPDGPQKFGENFMVFFRPPCFFARWSLLAAFYGGFGNKFDWLAAYRVFPQLVNRWVK
jgi:hypothetical protein